MQLFAMHADHRHKKPIRIVKEDTNVDERVPCPYRLGLGRNFEIATHLVCQIWISVVSIRPRPAYLQLGEESPDYLEEFHVASPETCFVPCSPRRE